MRLEIRPISDPTRFGAGPRKHDQFRADLTDTKQLLKNEVERLDGSNLVVELAVEPSDITVNGDALKSYSRPRAPGVVVAFDSKHGPLVYVCETYFDWRANLRAIAKTLEALRAVDRYGAVGHGEQYAGWAQIEAGPAGLLTSTTKERAAAIISDNAIESPGGGWPVATAAEILADPGKARMAVKYARQHTHPDRRRDDRTLWDQVEQAARVLGVLS